MSTTTYTVLGMTCAHCVSAVTTEVSALPGVDSVHVDLESGELSITTPGHPDEAAVRAAVDEAGYELAS